MTEDRIQPMLLWQFVAVFPTGIVRAVMTEEPWLTWLNAYEVLVSNQEREILERTVPLELSREAARRLERRFCLDLKSGTLHEAGAGTRPNGRTRLELSAIEVHDRFGGSTIEEVFENGTMNVHVEISRQTGVVEACGITLRPGMHEHDLLGLVKNAGRLSSYPEWTRYGFRRGDWSLLASFRSDGLRNIALSYRPTTESGNWSVEREKQRKVTHDEFLRLWLGWTTRLGRRRFEWGRVESERDPMTGEAAITVSYEA